MTGRTNPNILISGTPGTGKSTLCKKLARKIPELTVIDFAKEAQRRECRDEYDEELECWIVDEDKLADKLASEMEAGGNIVDYMHANFWSAHGLIDLVVTLRTDNTALYDRYTARGYGSRKIEQNIDCEIMNDIGSENADYFEGGHEEATATVVELISDSDQDMKRNVTALVNWVRKWHEQQEGVEDKSQKNEEGSHTRSIPRRISFDAVR